MALENVRFLAAGENPPALEGELWVPESATPVGGVVVTHMNSARGGSMQGHTVNAMCRGIQEAGLGWLRFNFRGVGASEGQYSDGPDEVQDVLGALAFLGARPGIRPDALGLAGHSFGARVSLMAQAAQPPIAALFLLAPPLPEPLPPERRPVCPYPVVIGDQDANLAEGGFERYRSHLPHPERAKLVPGIDHLWRGSEELLAEYARGFFAETLVGVASR
jgi:alpha/beta superfamily hydrolase